MLVASLPVATVASCGNPEAIDTSERIPDPLGTPVESGTAPRAGVLAAPPATPVPPPSAPAPADPSDAGSAPPGVGSAEERREVDEVLERYDRALSELSADPEAADDPADPLLAAWHRIVPAESELDAAVRDRIRGRRAEGVRVTPPPGGLSYVHRAVDVVAGSPPVAAPDADEERAFTWCGWSPGDAVRAGDGAVVDDLVGHARGTGTLRRPVGGAWTVATLFETELTTLPAGSPDPCR
jgi:hypothetical protein